MMRILYVEDNQANVFLVKRVARMGNHDVINYVDGSEVLKQFETIHPDLILMDIQLSGDLNGLDVVRELRRRGVSVPIIAVTAYAMVGDQERCIEAGCTEYMAKPLPIPRLVEMLAQYDKLRQTQTREMPAIALSDLKESIKPDAAPAPSLSEAAKTEGDVPSPAEGRDVSSSA